MGEMYDHIKKEHTYEDVGLLEQLDVAVDAFGRHDNTHAVELRSAW